MGKHSKLYERIGVVAVGFGAIAVLGIAVSRTPAEAAYEAEPGAQPAGRPLAQFSEVGPIHAQLESIEYQSGDVARVGIRLTNRTNLGMEGVSAEVEYVGGAGLHTYCCVTPEEGKLEPFAQEVAFIEIANAPEGPLSFTTIFEAVPTATPTGSPSLTPFDTETPTASVTPETPTATVTPGTPLPSDTPPPLIDANSAGGAPRQGTPSATPGGPVPAGVSEFSGPLAVRDWHIENTGNGSILTVFATNLSNIWLGGIQGELRLRGEGGTEVTSSIPALPALVGPGETTSLTSAFNRRLDGALPSFQAQFFGAVTAEPTATPTLTPTITPTVETTSTPTVTATISLEAVRPGVTDKHAARSSRPDQGAAVPMGEGAGPVLMAIDSWNVRFTDVSTRIDARVSSRTAITLRNLSAELTLRAGPDAVTDCCFAPDPSDLPGRAATVFSVDLAVMPAGSPLTFTLLVSGAADVPTPTPTPTRTPAATATSTTAPPSQTPGPGTEETPPPTFTATPDDTQTPSGTPGTATSETPVPTPDATVSATATDELTPPPTVAILTVTPPPGPHHIYLPRMFQR